MNVQKILAPKPTDILYTYNDIFRIANLLRLDSYKFAHPYAYPDANEIGGEIIGMTSYGTARVSEKETIEPFGIQMFVKEYLTDPITMADIDFAERFSEKHFGRKLFYRATWEKIVRDHKGLLPVIIRTVEEGTPIHGQDPVYSATAFGHDYFWLSSGIETMLQRATWYPSTITTLDRSIKIAIKGFFEDTGSDMNLLPFALHDFGGRGVTCAEQAQIGGAAHLVNFMGSDTVEGILAANFYYHCDMSAFSVYATEHSVECSFGLGTEQEINYLRHQLRRAKELGIKIVSIVIDGRDYERAAHALCTTLKQDILDCGAKVVFRPDSGDMMVTVPKILRMQEKAFGYTTTSKGFRQINTVGIIQGDGVDHLAIKSLYGMIMSFGWAAGNVIFGSGGALLQKVNRDTFKWAQKASSILVRRPDGREEWVGVAKDPVSDPGKKSREGVLTLVRDKNTGHTRTLRLEVEELTDNLEDMHKLVYYYGDLYNETTLEQVRARAEV